MEGKSASRQVLLPSSSFFSLQQGSSHKKSLHGDLYQFIEDVELLRQRIALFRKASQSSSEPQNSQPFQLVQNLEPLSQKIITNLKQKMSTPSSSMGNLQTQSEIKNICKGWHQPPFNKKSTMEIEGKDHQDRIYEVPIQMYFPNEEVVSSYLCSFGCFDQLHQNLQTIILDLLKESKQANEQNQYKNGSKLNKKQQIQKKNYPLSNCKSQSVSHNPSNIQNESLLIDVSSEVERWDNVERSLDSIKYLLHSVPKEHELDQSSQKFEWSIQSIQNREQISEAPQFFLKENSLQAGKVIYEFPIEMEVEKFNCKIVSKIVDCFIVPETKKFTPEGSEIDELFSLKISKSNPIQVIMNNSIDSKGDRETYFDRLHEQMQECAQPRFQQSIDLYEDGEDVNERLAILGEEKGDLMLKVHEYNCESLNLRRELNEQKKLFESMHYEKTEQNQILAERTIKLELDTSYLKKQLNIKQERIEELEKKSDVMSSSANEQKNKIKMLQSQREELYAKKEENLQLYTRLEEAEFHIEERTACIQRIEEEKHEIEDELHHVIRINEDLKRKIDQLYEEIDSKSLKLESLQEEYDELMESGRLNETGTTQLQTELKNLKQSYSLEVRKKDCIINEMEIENEKLSKSMEEKQKQISVLKEENEYLISENQKTKKQLEEQRSSLKERDTWSFDDEELLQFKKQLKNSLQLRETKGKSLKIQQINQKIKQYEQEQISDEQDEYTNELQKVVTDYEEIIKYQFNEINQLREGFYQYQEELNVAEGEIQKLELDLLQMMRVNTMTEKENRRLMRMMKFAENRGELVKSGLKLSKAVSQNDEQISHNNSTIKFRND